LAKPPVRLVEVLAAESELRMLALLFLRRLSTGRLAAVAGHYWFRQAGWPAV